MLACYQTRIWSNTQVTEIDIYDTQFSKVGCEWGFVCP